jgi:Fic/DOC family
MAEKQWPQALVAFVRESNRIEGIQRDPHPPELYAHVQLLSKERITVLELERFVAIIAGGRLRDVKGLDVCIGNHRPPPGGPEIVNRLIALLGGEPSWKHRSPLIFHQLYESLHPFTDGNGRSGRALWAWHMQALGRDPFALPFLHRWYYDSLELLRGRR